MWNRLRQILSGRNSAETSSKASPRTVIPAVTLLLLSGMVSFLVHAAERPNTKKPMQESVTLPADMNIRKRFGTIEDYLKEKRWSEAIDLLQEISQTDNRQLVQIPQEKGAESIAYLNVTTRCNVMLSKLPPDGLAIYRKKVDPQARRWMDQWKQTRDEADLQRVLREAYLSSVGDEALWALGEAAWDRGDTALARLYWTQLAPLATEARDANLPTVLRYPDTDLDQASILSRLVLCTIMEHDRVRAAIEIERVRERYPDAEGTLAGKQGKWVDLLKGVFDESIAWESSVQTDVPTFAINAHRSGTVPDSIEIGASKWSRPLPTNRLHTDRHFLVPERGPLSYHPVVYQDLVLVNNARSIWAWNLLTGEPAWPTERGTAEIYPPAPDDITGLPQQKANVGVPNYTMTVADGKLFARMGSSITNVAEGESAVDSDLVCLDLAAGQGKLVWKVAATDLIKGEHTWRFDGSPLVLSGRAYIVLARRPQFEFAIACLDAATGTLLWHRPVAYARGHVEEHQNRISHLLLAAGAGKLYLSTDAGAIIAVNASDGRLAWAVTYESLAPSKSLVSNPEQGMVPAMFHDGLVFAAPNDCSRVFCIEADSGQVRWQLRQPEPMGNRWRHMLGVVPGGESGRLIVSGATLSAIDIATRKIVYGPRAGVGNRSPLGDSERGSGRGVITGELILWPTRESISIYDAVSGAMIGNRPLNSGGNAETGGNLTVSQGMLLVAQPEKLVAYCEYSLLKQRLEKEISLRSAPAQADESLTLPRPAPRTLSSLLSQLSDIEYAQGNVNDAIDAMRKALSAATADQENDKATVAKVHSQLQELLLHASRAALAEGQGTVAIDRLIEARKLASTPTDVATILMAMAEAELARNRPVAAIDCWQQILDDNRVRAASYHESTAQIAATQAITELIHDRGRAVYAAVEHRASAEIPALLASGDLSALRQTLQRYPQATATVDAWRELANLELRAGRSSSALAIRAQLLDQSILPAERVSALVEWGDTLEAAGYWRSALSTWRRISATTAASLEINLEGRTRIVGDVIRDRLVNPIYKQLDDLDRQSSQHLARAWSVDLAEANATSNLLLPHGVAPAPELGCVLVQLRQNEPGATSSRWDCLDRATGRIRWSRSWTVAPQWSAYAESHLLLAMEDRLIAISLESGTELFSVPLAATPGANRQFEQHQMGHRSRGSATAKEPPIQFEVRDHFVLAFDPLSGLSVIDSRRGELLWHFTPPRGKLQREWSAGDTQIAIQTLQPAITWYVDVAKERHVTERPGSSEPWLQPPCLSHAETIASVFTDRRIEARSTLTGRTLWNYQGGMSFANADPVLWPAGQRLLLTVDGTSLTSINRATGRTDWSVGLADRPLVDPSRQVIAIDDHAYAANYGLLRRISLKQGTCDWEQFLGNATDQWSIAGSHSLIAAWPQSLPVAGSSARAAESFVVWCDAKTGRIVQKTKCGESERALSVTGDEHGWLIQTDRSLTAMQRGSERRDIAAKPK